MSETPERQWQRVQELTAARQPAAAQAIVEAMLASNPVDMTARLYLAGLLASQDRQQAAVTQALEAARHPPTDPKLLGDLVATLIWVGELAPARDCLASPVLHTSTVPQVLMRTAGQYQAIGDNAAALELMEHAGRCGAAGPQYRFHHAVQLGFNGHVAEARNELEQCIRMEQAPAYAFLELARMAHQTAERNHLDLIAKALGTVEPHGLEHAALEFARYKELEDLGHHVQAWQALARGNSIMRGRMPHDSAREATLIDQLIELCTRTFLAAPAHDDEVEGAQPIFIVGLPRSGTTVLERLLGGHSQIRSAGELGDFPRSLFLATDHLPAGMFDETTLARIRSLDWRQVGHSYLSQSRWRARSRPFYLDKLPRNWMVAGLIPLALPHARILHMVRDPMDVCFSNWRAFFGPGREYAYAYSLDALAAHHRQYRRLMEHWHRVAPGRILDVEYASLVRDPEAVTRKVLAFCGLDYEPGCADLTTNPAPSATLSMAQVRQPLSSNHSDAWRPYADELAGLQAAIRGEDREPRP